LLQDLYIVKLVLYWQKELTYNFVIGQTFIVIQKGSGQVTVVAESGATLYSLSSNTKTSGQYAQVSLLKIDSDKWVLSGDLTS
jgi:hypothetical protein